MNTKPLKMTDEESRKMDISAKFLASMYQKYGTSLDLNRKGQVDSSQDEAA